MAHYIGVDIIEIARIEEAVNNWGEKFLRRVYTNAELAACRHNPSSLAVRFAGKEAVMKLLGTGSIGVHWREVETLSHPGGRPLINLYGKAQSKADELDIKEIAVSLSHSKEYAVACVSAVSAANQSKKSGN
jgi:holo-[acyl-carrier protein] synthase